MTVKGPWNPSKNVLELKAAYFAVRAFVAHHQCCHVHLRLDNRTTVAFIQKMRGTRSEDSLMTAQKLWKLCLDRACQVFRI